MLNFILAQNVCERVQPVQVYKNMKHIDSIWIGSSLGMRAENRIDPLSKQGIFWFSIFFS